MKKYILSFFVAACLPMTMWAQDEPEVEPVFVEINETNFPDANFRAVVETFDTDSDGKLSEEEIDVAGYGSYDKDGNLRPNVINLDEKEIADLTGLQYFTKTKTLYLRSTSKAKHSFKSIDLSTLTELVDFRIAQSSSTEAGNVKLETLDISNNTKLEIIYCAYIGLKSLDVSNNLALKDLQCNNNNLTSLDVTQNTNLTYLRCSDNPLIGELNVENNTKLQSLKCENCGLTELDVTKNKSLKTFYCSNNSITEINVINNTALTGFRCNYNKLTELDVSTLTNVTNLECRNNLLTNLDVSKCVKLNNLNCESNHLTTLEMSSNTAYTTSNTLTCRQSFEYDLVVLDKEAVAIEVVPSYEGLELNSEDFGNLTGPGTNASEQELRQVDGKYYLVIAQPKEDVDYYNKKDNRNKDTKVVRYEYNTHIGVEGKNIGDPMGVSITTYPYIMYVSPNSKDKHDAFYSGTIYLDYDAVVPEGAECYIAKGILKTRKEIVNNGHMVTFEQLSMEKVAGAGEVIPANTPVYVKALTESGLFAFGRNKEELEPVTIPSGNILQGTFKDIKDVQPRQYLTLGRESRQGTGEIGFWPYFGTTIPAHRVYIDASLMTDNSSEESTAGAKGFVFHFDGEATGINQIENTSVENSGDDIWYNLQGMKILEKPSAKGVYIHKGKKIVVK